MVSPEELVELKSSKAQLEIGLIYLKRKRAEMDKQKALLERGPRDRDRAARLTRLSGELEAVVQEVTTREASIRGLAEEIERTERQASEEGLEHLLLANDGMAAELTMLRSEVLRALRALAEPLRRHQEVCERKAHVVRRLGTVHGRDLSYPNYLDCALLRPDDYDDAVRFALDVLKRLRVQA